MAMPASLILRRGRAITLSEGAPTGVFITVLSSRSGTGPAAKAARRSAVVAS